MLLSPPVSESTREVEADRRKCIVGGRSTRCASEVPAGVVGSDNERLEIEGGNEVMMGATDGVGNRDNRGVGAGAGDGAGIGIGTLAANYQREVVSHTHRSEPVPDLQALPLLFFFGFPGFLSFGGTTPSMYH